MRCSNATPYSRISLRIEDPAILSTSSKRAGLASEDAWRNPKILAVFVLIFVCGIATGAAVTRSFFHPTYVQRPSSPTIQALRESLQLSHDQERVVMQVLDDYAKYYENLEDDRRSIAEHGKRQILEVLRPDQQKRFLQMFGSPWTPPHQVRASN